MKATIGFIYDKHNYTPSDFNTELRLINDKALMQFISTCLIGAPKYFFSVPASSSGKYHPAYSLGDGGLVRHVKAAVKIAEDLLGIQQNSELNKNYHDEIISALILHDICKQGNNEGRTVFEHPLLASSFIHGLIDLTISNTLATKVNTVCDLIESHMGQWNTRDTSILPLPVSEAQKFVHMCDYLASRKYLLCDLKECE